MPPPLSTLKVVLTLLMSVSFFTGCFGPGKDFTNNGAGGGSGGASSGYTGGVLTTDTFSTGNTTSSITATDAALGGTSFAWIAELGIIGIAAGKAYPATYVGQEIKLGMAVGYTNCTTKFTLSTPPSAGVIVLYVKLKS